ncbi:uncharacterized protein LOC106180455 [Lingula anatina]|uniref:Uncharacterized protein LOC106180455 n=1 Tax=Lingula anatina TaxID=7574 RepID=A0A1S3KB84_LINAN|nr:uncharacterized protein LOC106180455 [Lingula anatina]|eukprot:XP_013419895.1 uncharacterized protein LOC106180455 [Lingula anatina]
MALHNNYSIVAVTVIAAVALAGTLGAVPISKKAAPDVGKKYNLHKGVKRENENVQVNVEDNVTVNNVTDEHFQVAMNSSGSLIIYKLEINNTYVCFFTPMNTSDDIHEV